jgi:DNA polymerase-4
MMMDQTTADSYPKKGRVILHIDMNAFYCSVHEAADPEQYKGKPTAVAGSVELRRGIIVTCSYEARKYGVKTGMQVREALKLCPQLICIAPNFELYRQFSRRLMDMAGNYSPLVEAMSIDECFVDITGSKQFGTPVQIAENLQYRIREELDLPCSIGIAPNKLLAKMASDMKKPNGITILRLRDVPKILWEQPCSELFGIGRKTAEKLKKMGIYTIGQLALTDDLKLLEGFGTMGPHLKQAANGLDESEVNPERDRNKSIGHTTTLPQNYKEMPDIQRVFLNIADQVSRRLRRQKLIAATIQITIRDPEMRTIQRSMTLSSPTEHADVIYQEACKLFEKHWIPGKPVRLLGITLQNLQQKTDAALQLDLFDYEAQPKKEKLTETLDLLRDKFGEGAVLTAGMVGDDPSTRIRNYKERGTSLQMDHLLADKQNEK